LQKTKPWNNFGSTQARVVLEDLYRRRESRAEKIKNRADEDIEPTTGGKDL